MRLALPLDSHSFRSTSVDLHVSVQERGYLFVGVWLFWWAFLLIWMLDFRQNSSSLDERWNVSKYLQPGPICTWFKPAWTWIVCIYIYSHNVSIPVVLWSKSPSILWLSDQTVSAMHGFCLSQIVCVTQEFKAFTQPFSLVHLLYPPALLRLYRNYRPKFWTNKKTGHKIKGDAQWNQWTSSSNCFLVLTVLMAMHKETIAKESHSDLKSVWADVGGCCWWLRVTHVFKGAFCKSMLDSIS